MDDRNVLRHLRGDNDKSWVCQFCGHSFPWEVQPETFRHHLTRCESAPEDVKEAAQRIEEEAVEAGEFSISVEGNDSNFKAKTEGSKYECQELQGVEEEVSSVQRTRREGIVQSSNKRQRSTPDALPIVAALEVPMVEGIQDTGESASLTSTTKVESEDFKLHQSSGKAGDRYREFFGDREQEQEEIWLSPLEMKCDDRLKDSVMVEKSTHHDSITSKDQPSGKNIDKMPTSEALHKAASNVAGEVPKDNWVACDRCDKWRLLPLGLDPSDLPENWLCSMLYWLPSRNRCSVSEEETTNITRGVNQSNPGGPTAEATLIGVQHPDQNHQNIGLPALLTGGKKKHGLKELSTITHKDGSAQLSKDGSAQLSNTTKKIIQ